MPVARFLLALLVAATLLGLNADERLPAAKRDKPKDSRSGAARVATPVTGRPAIRRLRWCWWPGDWTIR